MRPTLRGPASTLIAPAPVTAWPRVFLAGDWTATGWPATMEGAVRSGYLAAEALAATAGVERRPFYLSRPASHRPHAPICIAIAILRIVVAPK